MLIIVCYNFIWKMRRWQILGVFNYVGKTQNFCTHAKRDESGWKRILCISTFYYLQKHQNSPSNYRHLPHPFAFCCWVFHPFAPSFSYSEITYLVNQPRSCCLASKQILDMCMNLSNTFKARLFDFHWKVERYLAFFRAVVYTESCACSIEVW